MENNVVITISRQYGSAGKEIGIALGKLLGIKVYDNELLTMAAEKKGLPADYLSRVDERATGSLLYSIAMSVSHHRGMQANTEMSLNDRLFITQTQIIRDIAENESAIFIGRCADYVLRNHQNRISVFVHADAAARVARVCELEGCTEKEAEELILKKDKQRVNYYNYYTGAKWGKADRYHIAVDSGVLGVEGTAELLAELVKKKNA